MRGGGYVAPAGTCRRWRYLPIKGYLCGKTDVGLLLPDGRNAANIHLSDGLDSYI